VFEGGINFIFITLHIDEKRGIKVMYTLTQRDIDKLNFRIFDYNVIEMQRLALNPNILSLIYKSLKKFGKIIVDNYGCKILKLHWVFTLKVDANQVEPVQRPTEYEKSFILLLISKIKEQYTDYELSYEFLTDYVDKSYNNANNMSNNPAIINIYNVTVNKTINIDKSHTKSVSYSEGCNYRRDRRMDYIRGMKLPKPSTHLLPQLSLF